MKRLIMANLYNNEEQLKDIFDDIYNDYKNDIRRMKAYERNDIELFIYLPKDSTFTLILPYVDPIDSLYGYGEVTFRYDELFEGDLQMAFKEIFLQRISAEFDAMYIEDRFNA